MKYLILLCLVTNIIAYIMKKFEITFENTFKKELESHIVKNNIHIAMKIGIILSFFVNTMILTNDEYKNLSPLFPILNIISMLFIIYLMYRNVKIGQKLVVIKSLIMLIEKKTNDVPWISVLNDTERFLDHYIIKCFAKDMNQLFKEEIETLKKQ